MIGGMRNSRRGFDKSAGSGFGRRNEVTTPPKGWRAVGPNNPDVQGRTSAASGRSRLPRPLFLTQFYLLHPWSRASRDTCTSLCIAGTRGSGHPLRHLSERGG